MQIQQQFPVERSRGTKFGDFVQRDRSAAKGHLIFYEKFNVHAHSMFDIFY